MPTSSIRNSILLNLAAFIFVFILEVLSGLMFMDNYDTAYDFYVWQFSYTVMIMLVIWINHYLLIPFVFDKKHYVLYGILLFVTICLGTQIKALGVDKGFEYTSKLFFFLLYTTGTGMAAYFLRRSMIFQKNNAEKDKLQKDLELNYLKEQVNPHFLFNSLNSIYALSQMQSPETPNLVMQLSELMRYQLESSKKESVLLKEELDFIENYLLLEETRLSDRCTIEFLISGEVPELYISPMLLIPFVENAIKHGAQSTNSQSTIDISVSVKNSTLHFIVINSKPNVDNKTNRKGFGLENVRRRLNLLYSNVHSLDIQNEEQSYKVKLVVDLSRSVLTPNDHD